MSIFSPQYILDHLHQVRSQHRFALMHDARTQLKQPDPEQQQQLSERFERSYQQFLTRQQQRPDIQVDQNLPIGEQEHTIADAIERHQVVIVAGETGSGKTTQLPKICLKLGRGSAGLIGHTQPRRLAARSVANRIAEELHTPLGELVGFQVRFSDQSKPNTQIKLMTDGILLAEIQRDRFLSQYDTLIIDEAHERSLNIDFLLGFIRQLLPKRPDLKVIITSATIDLDRFSKHFNDAPIIEVSGRTYPVEMLYRPMGEDPDSDYSSDLPRSILAATEEIIHLEQSGQTPSKGGDILVFLPGEREIREAANVLRKSGLPHLEVLPLYARLSNAEQQRIFSPHSGRRIVLSTNVAETSLTVPGIHYVIDPGLARISRYSYRSKVQRLPIEPISQASANQRAGRCGRVAPGLCVRLYSEDDFQSRPEFTDAEILRTNLASVILQMLHMRLGEIEQFPFIDPPDKRFIKDGYTLLKELTAVSDKGQLTKLGKQLARLPVDPRLGRMLIEAQRKTSLREVLIIVSALAVQDPRERPQEKQQQAQQKHAQDADKDSDFISLLNLWNRYEEKRQELSQSQLRKYCEKEFLHFLRMREWRDIHRQLHLSCKEIGLQQVHNEATYQQIHTALLAGLLSQVANFKEERTYTAARGRTCVIHPSSAVSKKKPKWIMAAELVETSQLFARTVAKIEPEWIEPLAEHLVKKQYFEPHWEKKKAQVVALEQVSLYGLIIVSKRRVHYGAIDPEQSREIFIQSGLVEGQYRSQKKFDHHNRKLVKSLTDLEDKSRRRDILVDDHVLFAFYDQRLPEDVVNGAGFEHWLKDEQHHKSLFMTRELLLHRDAKDVSVDQFPDTWHYSGMTFPLTYHFQPGAKDDGVTLRVPVQALNQIPEAKLQWLVPGMLKEKCVALVKSLPKAIRKNFVPVPHFVDAALPDLIPDDKPLTEALGIKLFRMTGIRIPDEAWQENKLDDHYLFNIQVLDNKGKVIRQGRDLEALRTEVKDLPIEEFPTEKQEPVLRYQHWPENFSASLPAQRQVKRAGIQMRVFPALQDCQDGVEIHDFDSPEFAEQQHRAGLIRLLRLDLPDQIELLLSDLKKHNQLELAYAPVGKADQLREDFVAGVFNWAFIEPWLAQDKALPRSEVEFDRMKQQSLPELNAVGLELGKLVNDILRMRHQVAKQIKGKVSFVLAFVYADIKAQLEHLVYPGFIYLTPKTWLEQYPRYLHAIQLRLDRSKGIPSNEQLLIDELNDFWQRYHNKASQLLQQQLVNEQLEEFRWLIEEYRVSLFAQKLGTVQPVSQKRLTRLWQEIS